MRKLAASTVLILAVAACGGSTAETASPAAATTTVSVSPDPTASPASTTPTTKPLQDTSGTVYEQVMVLGEGDGLEFNAPNHLALDADGHLYVTEFVGGRVFVFSSAGGVRSSVRWRR